MKMDFKKIIEKVKEYMFFLKKHSFGSNLMKKKSLSTLEKLILLLSTGCVILIISITFIIIPGISKMGEVKASIRNIVSDIYGEEYGKEGKKYLNDKLKKELTEEEEKVMKNKKDELEILNKSLLKDNEIYPVVTLLEDYTVTMSTEEAPIILKNISFGKEENISIPAEKLQQKKRSFVLEKDLREIFGGDEKNWPEIFFDSMKGEKVFFRNDITEESFSNISDSVKSKKLLIKWKNSPKITIPAEYRVLPINVSIDASNDKFEQFLKFIYHSGDIKKYYFKGSPVPIMSVESLNLPINEIDKEVSKEILVKSYSLKLNVYFQKEEKFEKMNNDKNKELKLSQ